MFGQLSPEFTRAQREFHRLVIRVQGTATGTAGTIQELLPAGLCRAAPATSRLVRCGVKGARPARYVRHLPADSGDGSRERLHLLAASHAESGLLFGRETPVPAVEKLALPQG